MNNNLMVNLFKSKISDCEIALSIRKKYLQNLKNTQLSMYRMMLKYLLSNKSYKI